MKKICLLIILFAPLVSVLLPSDVGGQDVETVLGGLNRPTSIAIQPETGHVFVVESGAHRVIRIVDGKLEPVIVDFKDAVLPISSAIYPITPLGLVFLDKETLVVGQGVRMHSLENLRVYKIPEPGSDPITADKSESDSVSLTPSDDGNSLDTFRHYVGIAGIALGDEGIFMICLGDQFKHGIGLATLEGGKLKDFVRHIESLELAEVAGSTAIAISPERYLIVGHNGEGDSKESLLTFYKDGEVKAKFKTGFQRITGLAYGPNHGRLFATDFGWPDTASGALYKIVEVPGKTVCKMVKIADLKKPAALAFNAEGDLYITLRGDHVNDPETPNGKLVMIKGLDVDPNEE